jgi:hypothetical protein
METRSEKKIFEIDTVGLSPMDHGAVLVISNNHTVSVWLAKEKFHLSPGNI